MQLRKSWVVSTLKIIRKVSDSLFVPFFCSCFNFLGREFNSIIKAATGLSSQQQETVRTQVSTKVVFRIGSRKGYFFPEKAKIRSLSVLCFNVFPLNQEEYTVANLKSRQTFTMEIFLSEKS